MFGEVQIQIRIQIHCRPRRCLFCEIQIRIQIHFCMPSPQVFGEIQSAPVCRDSSFPGLISACVKNDSHELAITLVNGGIGNDAVFNK